MIRPHLRLARDLLIAAAVGFGVGAVAIVADGLRDEVKPSDVAIVLGSKVYRSGRPSPSLRARLDETLTLYRRGVFKAVIVSGGVGAEGFDEAQVMKTYLVARGVPSAAIIADSHGDTTWATARNSVAIMRAHGWKSALAVTQYFHISRTRLALHRCGIVLVATAHPHVFFWRDLYSIPREVIALPVYYFS
jgi:vancomycin permeability regulator SanA